MQSVPSTSPAALRTGNCEPLRNCDMREYARLSQRLRRHEACAGLHGADACTVRVARDADERLEAATLVARMYRTEGYLTERKESHVEPFYGLHHLLDETTVFVASDGERIVGTLAVILDSPAGLPMETLYGDEIDRLRREGRRPCEFCSLAVDPELGRRGSKLLLSLFRLAYVFAYYHTSSSDVCLTLKPSHRPFYDRLGFEELGPFRLDRRFCEADTLALRLPRETVDRLWTSGQAAERRFRPRAFCSGRPTLDEERRLHDGKRQKRSLREIWELINRRPNLLVEAKPAQYAYLKKTLRGKRTSRWTLREAACAMAQKAGGM